MSQTGSDFHPMRRIPATAPWNDQDVLVLFGELFSRGYANGLVEEAERRGMKIVRATVGRRDKDGTLRALNAEEAAAVSAPFINVPLEAGFDMEPDSKGMTPVDQLKEIKLSDWESARLDFDAIEESRKKAIQRFRAHTAEFMKQLEPHVKGARHVLFAHLMAGGVPRAKIVMPLMNRAFKGQGERYLSSETFWTSDIGRLCQVNFMEVTAETFLHLVDLSAGVRDGIEKRGGGVHYLAYGYHGTDTLHGGKLRWQTYTPYLQGWAKMHLENLSKDFSKRGLSTCVYNCPEILTNSSSIFQGVELSLYPLIESYRSKAPASAVTKKVLADCQALLKEPHTLDEIHRVTEEYFANPEVVERTQYTKWPQHSSQTQLATMLQLSDKLFDMHKDTKHLITSVLSEEVFHACGTLMLHDSFKPAHPVTWIGHDVITDLRTQ